VLPVNIVHMVFTLFLEENQAYGVLPGTIAKHLTKSCGTWLGSQTRTLTEMVLEISFLQTLARPTLIKTDAHREHTQTRSVRLTIQAVTLVQLDSCALRQLIFWPTWSSLVLQVIIARKDLTKTMESTWFSAPLAHTTLTLELISYPSACIVQLVNTARLDPPLQQETVLVDTIVWLVLNLTLAELLVQPELMATTTVRNLNMSA
jgi:hypothetical protein